MLASKQYHALHEVVESSAVSYRRLHQQPGPGWHIAGNKLRRLAHGETVHQTLWLSLSQPRAHVRLGAICGLGSQESKCTLVTARISFCVWSVRVAALANAPLLDGVDLALGPAPGVRVAWPERGGQDQSDPGHHRTPQARLR